jgi:UDP-N-acetylglucosamine 2-epimerase
LARHVFTVVGARPQFVKAAVVSRALQSRGLSESLVHTGQHYDANMSRVFFDELGLPAPTHHLGIGGLAHGAMTGRMLEAIEGLLLEQRPDVVLVYGDTNSTLAGALAAAKLRIPVAHVEAGMRSFDRGMPEEMNRVLTDHVSTLLLVTGPAPAALLAREGITAGVHVVGDVMLDAQRAFAQAGEATGARRALGLEAGSYVLATLHRAENTDDPAKLGSVLAALAEVAASTPVVLPLHPRTRARVDAAGLSESLAALTVVPPCGYLEMLDLEQGARLVITDSGGVQKEAYWARVPCLTLRTATEWPETVERGWNHLVGADRAAIVQIAERLLSAPPSAAHEPLYGDGRAAERVAQHLAELVEA